jgi:diguanylate cyclase (GGDEF)-like protein
MDLISRLSSTVTLYLKRTFVQEILVTSIITLILFWHASNADLFEMLIEFLEEHEEYELDEIVVLLLISILGFVFIIFRRTAHLKNEIGRRKKAEQRISKLAYYDSLTGLANRELCSEKLNNIISNAKQKSYRVAALFIDLDNFKGINDSFGHANGDKLLKQVGERLSNELREKDLVARISGDEFVIIIDKFKGESCLSSLLVRLLKSASMPFDLEGGKAYISLSIGVSIYPSNGDSAEDLLKHADAAMYEAKNNGKNTYKFYSKEVRAVAKRRSRISQNLRGALSNDEFSIVYQPILDCKLNKIVGAEALIRWESPELGHVTPDEFIPIAEENGTIFSIDNWMLLNVCKQNKAWQIAGIKSITVSVNISARQLNTDKIVGSVSCALNFSGLEARYLKLEVTETVMMENLNDAVGCLNKLESLGISIVLDDFGTGYASINYLRKLHLKFLKIDRSFLEKVEINKEDRTTYETIIKLASNLKIQVTAEGVETKEQLHFLQNSSCELYQGYLFSAPINEEKFRELYIAQSISIPSYLDN